MHGVNGTVAAPLARLPYEEVPANVGPRTMDYNALFNQAIYDVTLDSNQGLCRDDRRCILD